MNPKDRTFTASALLAAVLGMMCIVLSSCSISDSSKSFSDSSSSICTSSSGEELSEENKKAYMNEIMLFTDSMARTKITSDDFMRGISRIAERYGVTNWEFMKDTYIAIGRGLKHAEIPKDAIDSLQILQGMTGPRSTMKSYILEGYDS